MGPALPARYELWPSADRALLGRGGAGEVWRARDVELGVLVALKVLRGEGARFRTRLEREAVLAAQVGHPNVVAVHDMGETLDGHPYLAFALASDGSLLDQVRHPPPWAQLEGFLVEGLRALGALHARGLLHLDVKLGNFLIHRAGPSERTLWLADLGVARLLDPDDHPAETVLGTVAYMASERLTGQTHRWGPPTDLFSIGAVYYRILSGVLPFPERDPTEALKARANPPTTVPLAEGMHIPRGIDRVIVALLPREPHERFDLAADVIRAIANASPGAVATAAGVPTWHRPDPSPFPSAPPPRTMRRRVPVAPGLLAHRDVKLVGRDDELAALWRVAGGVARDRTSALVHISGPRGVGRTRLVLELTRMLEEAGLGEGVTLQFAVREGPALGLRGALRRLFPPDPNPKRYQRQVQAVLARDRLSPPPSVRGDAQLLTSWIAPRDGVRPPDRSFARALLLDTLLRRAWRGLSWLVIEDAHLAGDDDDAWALADAVLSRPGPVLVLVTSRSDVPTPPMAALEARFGPRVTRLPLEPLRRRAAAALVAEYLPLQAELTRRLAEHTGGNPRYMRELLLHWVRAGMLQPQTDERGDPTWHLRQGADPFPDDRHDFAAARLALALRDHPDWLDPLLALALAGRGTPERVIAAVVGQALDALIVEGLVRLERGAPVLVPPELPEAVRAHADAPARAPAVHEALADAWTREGVADDPVVAAAIGRHLAEAGRTDEALVHLDRALGALRHTLPLPELDALARRAQAIAEVGEGVGSPVWARATMARSEALWHAGEGDRALELDKSLASLDLPATERVRAACLHAAHLRDGLEGLRRLAEVAPLVAEVATDLRARFLVERARCHHRALDVSHGLADIDAALELDAAPDTATDAFFLRALLVTVRDRAEAYEAALTSIDLAAEHGFVRTEALAWGVAAEHLVAMGRAEEAVQRLRAEVERLRAHGDLLEVGHIQISLGETLRIAGRDEEAREAYRAALSLGVRDQNLRQVAATNLAIMASADRDAPGIARARAEVRGPEGLVTRHAWALLLPIRGLLAGESPPVPPLHEVAMAVHIGSDGVFLALALADLLDEAGRPDEARKVREAVYDRCAAEGVPIEPAQPLLERFRSFGAS